jgi:transposase-like protein
MQNEAIRDELLKVDRRGRVRVSPERREALLDEFERSGVSAVQFALHIGVKYQTFAHWRQMRSRKRQRGGGSMPLAPASLMPSGSSTGTRWVEAVVEAGGDVEVACGSVLRVTLPGGASMEISGAAQMNLAAELLRALETKVHPAC